jgi:hypothetical protein
MKNQASAADAALSAQLPQRGWQAAGGQLLRGAAAVTRR